LSGLKQQNVYIPAAPVQIADRQFRATGTSRQPACSICRLMISASSAVPVEAVMTSVNKPQPATIAKTQRQLRIAALRRDRVPQRGPRGLDDPVLVAG
jgi:hypothetical protein